MAIFTVCFTLVGERHREYSQRFFLARSVITRTLVFCHLVIAVVYSTIILGLGLAHLLDRLEHRMRHPHSLEDVELASV